jgi:hypothetical protein
MAVVNMVSSNINQWTMLAAMIPIVFNVSLGHWEPVVLDAMHCEELALTLVQSIVGGLILLDLRFHFIEALLLLFLWGAQFLFPGLRLPITYGYLGWLGILLVQYAYEFLRFRKLPRAVTVIGIAIRGR